ncbi:MAG: 3-dehydroquinate synthase [Porphyromonadaceae bacterium]|nr:3-dehydroquinate synthase [Porphyromonadaceae bacterium]
MIIGHHILESEVASYLQSFPCDGIYLLIDDQVEALHSQALEALKSLTSAEKKLVITSGEVNKHIDSVQIIWQWLMRTRASRRSILVIIGGGALTDMGGFAAATYMRGIRTVNIPTTLLGMVDASVGGKTAIDFGGVKNIVGAFHEPEAVFLDISFLRTLPLDELYSGYAELIKTALLDSKDFWQEILRSQDPQYIEPVDWIRLIDRAVTYKERIVKADPTEQGLRRVLNLGHTVGHALEAFSHSSSKHRFLMHGEAVIVGMLIEIYASVVQARADRDVLRQLHALSKELYSPFYYTCKDYPEIIRLMRSDKKNSNGEIIVIGLMKPGEPIELSLSALEVIKDALDFYRETFGN